MDLHKLIITLIVLISFTGEANAELGRAIAYNDTEQSHLTQDTPTKVYFNAELNDTNNEWNTNTSTFTAAQAGWYLVTGKLLFMYTTANRDYIAYVQKNDPGTMDGTHRAYFGIAHANAINSAAGLTVPIIFVEHMNAGDNLTVFAQANSGNNNVAIGGLCAAGEWCGKDDRAYTSFEVIQLS